MVVKSEENRKIVQCTIVGDGMVGKSAMALSFADNSSPEGYVATVFDNFAGHANVAGDDYTISIFDSAGQHDYESLRAFTYKESEVFVVCYSVVDRESFDSVKDFWLPEMKLHMRRKKPVVLVATQSDLRDSDCDDHVSAEEEAQLAKQIGAECFVECSAVNRNSVKKVFERVVTASLKYRKRRHSIVNKIFGK